MGMDAKSQPTQPEHFGGHPKLDQSPDVHYGLF